MPVRQAIHDEQATRPSGPPHRVLCRRHATQSIDRPSEPRSAGRRRGPTPNRRARAELPTALLGHCGARVRELPNTISVQDRR